MPDKNHLIHAFVRIASEIPEVQTIILTGRPDWSQRIWTIIDAPRMESEYRNRVYQAELDVMHQFEDVPMDFYVLNLRETSSSLEDLLPPQYRFLFQRGQTPDTDTGGGS